MRVLHVGKFYPPEPGGMERVVQELCQSEQSTVDTRALVASRSAATINERVNGVPVTRVASIGRIGSVGICPTFPIWMRRLSGDVVVIHEPNPLAVCSHLVAKPAGRLVVWFHAEIVRPQWKYRLLYRPWQRRLLARADRIIVSSPNLRDNAVELQEFRAKCTVIPFGIEPRRLSLTESVAARASVLRQQHRSQIVLFVGRLVSYKGADVLLRALRGLDATGVIVGDGPLRSDLQALARDLGLQQRVLFRGEVSHEELVAWYHACDLFVLPSVTKAEAFGLVQAEAMACGKPVVSTQLPSGVPWVNQHRETGLVVPPGDVEALRDALGALLDNESLRQTMGERGRLRVRRELTVERMVRQTTSLYEELLIPIGPVATEVRVGGNR